jgi:hypothetical protein
VTVYVLVKEVDDGRLNEERVGKRESRGRGSGREKGSKDRGPSGKKGVGRRVSETRVDKVGQHPVVDSGADVLALGGGSRVGYDTESVVEKERKREESVRGKGKEIANEGVNSVVMRRVIEKELNRRKVGRRRVTTQKERGEKVFRKGSVKSGRLRGERSGFEREKRSEKSAVLFVRVDDRRRVAVESELMEKSVEKDARNGRECLRWFDRKVSFEVRNGILGNERAMNEDIKVLRRRGKGSDENLTGFGVLVPTEKDG